MTINESISAAIDNEIALRGRYRKQLDSAASFKDALAVFFQKDIAHWFSNQRVGVYNTEAVLMKSFMAGGMSPDEATLALENVYARGEMDTYSSMSWQELFTKTIDHQGKKYPLAAGLRSELVDQEYISFNQEVGLYISNSSMLGLLKDKDVAGLRQDGSKVRLDDIQGIRERLTHLSGAIDLEGPADTTISQDVRRAINRVNTLLGEKPPNLASIAAVTNTLRTELPDDVIRDLRDRRYISDALAGQLMRSIHWDMPTLSADFLEIHRARMEFERSRSQTEEQLMQPAPRDFRFYPGPDRPEPLQKASLQTQVREGRLVVDESDGVVLQPIASVRTDTDKGPNLA